MSAQSVLRERQGILVNDAFKTTGASRIVRTRSHILPPVQVSFEDVLATLTASLSSNVAATCEAHAHYDVFRSLTLPSIQFCMSSDTKPILPVPLRGLNLLLFAEVNVILQDTEAHLCFQNVGHRE